MFEIGVQEKKGKTQVIIVESKGGVSSWVRLGPMSVEVFLDNLNQCIKEEENENGKGDGKKMGELIPWCGMRTEQGTIFD